MSLRVVIFVPSTNQFKFPAALMKEKRRYHEMVLLPSGKVLIIGGVTGASQSTYEYSDTMEIYDPANGTFTLLAKKMSKKRTGHRAVLLANGKVLIVGGYCGRNCQGGQLVHDLYDPLTDTITPIAPVGDLPSSHAAVLLDDGRVLVVGDENSKQKVVAFDPSGGGGWTLEPDMLAPGQSRVEAVKLGDGSVLVVGGIVSTSPYEFTKQAQRFYP